MVDLKVIAEKIIQCYNIFIVKLREKNYQIIENHPDREKEIKQRMILSNIYSMRMNVDLSFKRIMFQRLNQALETKITNESLKKLFSVIIDEIERPSEQFFDIFESSSQPKIKVNWEPFFEYLNYIITLQNQDLYQSFSEENIKNIEFYKKILKETEKDTTLYRATEDMILEFESGIFFPRYFKNGEITNFLLYHFNPYLILFMEQRIQNMPLVVRFNTPLLRLMPEYYICHNKISHLIYDTLNKLFELPKSLSESSLSLLSIHFMDVLMLLLFEELEDKEKLNILNKIYFFDIQLKDIETIANNLESFQKIAIFSNKENSTLKDKKEFNSKLSYLWNLGQEMFTLELHQYCQIIYNYLYHHETDEFFKVNALDNIATAKRDLGEFSDSIQLYEQTIEFYENNKLFYRKFLAKKNIAYCYYCLGIYERANQNFAELEKNFSVYTEDELVGVYNNLAYRYRSIYNFEKEEEYLNLLLEKINQNHPLYFEIENRSLEIGMCFNPIKGELDKEELMRRDINNNYEKYKKFAYTHLNNNNLEQCQYYLKLAYKDKRKDPDYWKILSVVFILKEEWKNLINSGEEILKLDSYDYFGHFYQCVAYIAERKFPKVLFHILKIESEIDNVTNIDLLAFANLSRALSFICFFFKPFEIKKFLDFVFENNQENKFSIDKLLSGFASILAFAKEKELSGYIYKKLLDTEESLENIIFYAGWCYQFNDYENSKHFYMKALKLSPNNINLLECLSNICLICNEFLESIEYMDKILGIIKPEIKKPYEDKREYIIFLKDSKIRYEKIPFKDVRIIFNTMEQQLKLLNPAQEIEFGNILTEFSKGLENFLAKTLGLKIYEYLEKNHLPIPNLYRYGNNKDIKPINRLFLNFLDDPKKNNPTVGNWKYIIKGILQDLNPENPILQEIYDFVKKSPFYNKDKLNLILQIADLYLNDRNIGTHKKLYSKEEIETLLKKMIPHINNLIEYIISI